MGCSSRFHAWSRRSYEGKTDCYICQVCSFLCDVLYIVVCPLSFFDLQLLITSVIFKLVLLWFTTSDYFCYLQTFFQGRIVIDEECLCHDCLECVITTLSFAILYIMTSRASLRLSTRLCMFKCYITCMLLTNLAALCWTISLCRFRLYCRSPRQIYRFVPLRRLNWFVKVAT